MSIDHNLSIPMCVSASCEQETVDDADFRDDINSLSNDNDLSSSLCYICIVFVW